MKRFIPCMVGVGVLLICIAIMGVTKTNCNTKLANAKDKVADLQNQLDVKRVEQESDTVQLKKETTGLDSARVSEDDKAFEEVIKPVFTWSTGDEYDAARNQMISRLGKDSDFVKTVMPKQKTSKDGKYKWVDVNEANCKFEDMSSYVTKVDGTNYSYLAFITYSVNDSSGNEAKNQCVITYTMDANKTISDIKGYTL